MAQANLIIVGAGAKAAAIAAKVHVLNSLGLGPVTLTIIEGNRAGRVVAGAQRRDLRRGAAGDSRDQGCRVPVSEL